MRGAEALAYVLHGVRAGEAVTAAETRPLVAGPAADAGWKTEQATPPPLTPSLLALNLRWFSQARTGVPGRVPAVPAVGAP